MIAKKFILQPLAVAALVLSAGASHAAFIGTFTSSASFTAGTAQQGTDNFTGLSIVSSTPSPLARATQTGVAYSYTADATPTGTFFGGGVSAANPFLSTNTATDSIILSGFSPAIRAIGGEFFASNVSGLYTAGGITITALDLAGATSTVTLNPTSYTAGSFYGFLSNSTIVSLTITSVQPTTGFVWPSVDNVVLAVPEPGTYGLMLAGLGVVGFMARRRRG
jgi:hypothetical protein